MIRELNNFENVVCSSDTHLSDVLGRINSASPLLFQIIVDEGGTVLGTVTDGDARRALLRGETLASPVGRWMRMKPVVGQVGDDAANLTLVHRFHFLPIVDTANRLLSILVEDTSSAKLNHAVVMAGGFGRRLGHLTRETPKPLLSVGGRPILDRVLARLEDGGIEEIVISAHYRGDQVVSFVSNRANRAEVRVIEEQEPLGTAGVLGLISSEIDRPFVVVNGDVLTEVAYPVLFDFHLRHGFDGTIAVSRHEIEIPYGVVSQDASGNFLGIDEKPRIGHFVAAGIYCFSPEFAALTPRGRKVDMPELIGIARGAGLRLGVFPVHEYWQDVGRPDDLAQAHYLHDRQEKEENP
jgi:dTDP-glucose pyrophosphorylase